VLCCVVCCVYGSCGTYSTGAIPETLHALQQLKKCNLSENQLSGAFDSVLGLFCVLHSFTVECLFLCRAHERTTRRLPGRSKLLTALADRSVQEQRDDVQYAYNGIDCCYAAYCLTHLRPSAVLRVQKYSYTRISSLVCGLCLTTTTSRWMCDSLTTSAQLFALVCRELPVSPPSRHEAQQHCVGPQHADWSVYAITCGSAGNHMHSVT